MWTFVSDLEGRWDRFVSFCSDNPGLWLEGDDLVLTPGWRFVYGGDAFDRGPAARRLARALVRAAGRYPDRVTLLAGNRDINKLRLPRELGPFPKPEDLKAIFARTMGAPDAFEHRRTELGPVSDDDVVASFLEDVTPSGVVADYLRHARMTCRIGDTLFVHGGIPDAAWLVLPDGTRCPDLASWADDLDKWFLEQLATFHEAPNGDGGALPRWWPLIAYQMPQLPGRTHPGSIIYGRNVSDGNNPALPAPEVRNGLLRVGVAHLVVGHTPNGDMPSFVRDDAGFTLVVADASYPRSTVCPQLWHDGQGLKARGRAVLEDQRDLAAVADLRNDVLVGRSTAGRLDKGLLETGERLTFQFRAGTQFEQVAVASA